MNAYDLKSVTVKTFDHGKLAGQRKAIQLPAGAVPCGVVSGYDLKLYYLVPAAEKRV